MHLRHLPCPAGCAWASSVEDAGRIAARNLIDSAIYEAPYANIGLIAKPIAYGQDRAAAFLG